MIWFALLALLSEIIGTIGGFGSSVFFVPLAGLFFDFHSVLAITGILHVFSNISKLILFLKHINLKISLLLGIPSLIFVFIGARLSIWLIIEKVELILGVFLIVFSLILLIKNDFKLKQTKSSTIISGSLAGFLAGLFGTGGAIRGLALSSYNLEKNVYVATSAIIDLGVDITRSAVYLSSGFLNKEQYYLLPILFVVAIIGSYIGKFFLNYISQSNFRKISLILILSIGIFTIWKTISL